MGHGVEIRPIEAMINHNTTEVFFDNLQVPPENLIGEKGRGFRYILDGMNAERILVAQECIGDGRRWTNGVFGSSRKATGGLRRKPVCPRVPTGFQIMRFSLLRYAFRSASPEIDGVSYRRAPRGSDWAFPRDPSSRGAGLHEVSRRGDRGCDAFQLLLSRLCLGASYP